METIQCAWCKKERDVKTFHTVRLVFGGKQLAAVCDPHNIDENGVHVAPNCENDMRAFLTEQLTSL